MEITNFYPIDLQKLHVSTQNPSQSLFCCHLLQVRVYWEQAECWGQLRGGSQQAPASLT